VATSTGLSFKFRESRSSHFGLHGCFRPFSDAHSAPFRSFIASEADVWLYRSHGDGVCRMNPQLARRVAQLALERCEIGSR